jgi:ubiquitin carboxyl-terminal hydrolase 1
MSKINDYIPTPLSMDCFCTECHQTKPSKHNYRLYAVIMHLGATLASGHYIAYVRASDLTTDYLNCLRNSTVERKNKKGILKYFSRSSDVGRNTAVLANVGASSSGLASTNGVSSSGSGSEPTTCCKSINCCGIRTLGQLIPATDASCSSSVSSLPPIPSSLPPKALESGKDFGPDLVSML